MTSPDFNCSAIPHPTNGFGAQNGTNDMYIALYSFGWIFSLICVGVFEYFKKVKNYERLRVRQSLIVYISCLGVLFAYNALPLEGLVGSENYPCFLKMAFALGIIPFLGGSFMTKLLIFYFQSAMQRLAVIQQRQRHETAKRMSRAVEIAANANNPQFDGNESVSSSQQVRGSNMNTTVDPFMDEVEEYQTKIAYLKDLYVGFNSVFFHGDTKRTESESLREKRLKALAFIQSHQGTLVSVFLILLPVLFFGLYLLIVYPEYSRGCRACDHPLELDAFLVVHAVCIVCGGVFFAYRLHRKTRDDPWGIVNECSIMLLVATLGVAGFILEEFAYVRVETSAGNVSYEHHVLLEISVSGLLFVQTFYVVFVAWRYDDNSPRPVSTSPRHHGGGRGGGGGGGTKRQKRLVPDGKLTTSSTSPRHHYVSGKSKITNEAEAEIPVKSQSSTTSFPSREALSRPLEDQQKLQQQRSAQQLSRTSISQISQTEEETAGGSQLTLWKILANADLLRRFQEHLIGELGIESLLYLQDIAMWKEDFAGLNENTRRVRAKRLVKLYVRPNARYEININYEMRQELVRAVLNAPEHEQISRELFDDSVAEIHHLLEGGAVPRFMKRLRQAQHATYSPSTVTVAEEDSA